jgi:hypothetical protein
VSESDDFQTLADPTPFAQLREVNVKTNPARSARTKLAEEPQRRLPWLELLFFVGLLGLVLQTIPGVWSGTVTALNYVGHTTLAILDVRQWSWKVFAALSTGAIVALVALRAWLDRDKNNN